MDRDGCLTEEVGYVNHPSRIRLLPRTAAAVRRLNEAGVAAVMVTNQAGVARGYFTLDELAAVAEHLEAVVLDARAVWGAFYACPHLPEGVNEYAVDCDCRKPAPGMIREAAADLGVRPEDSWFIGDTWMDMAAGRAVGCRTILVGREWRQGGSYPPEARPDHAVPDLAAAAEVTLGQPAEVDESECADMPVVSWETFGAGFVTTHCQGCHASSAPDRRGAPAQIVFDSEADVVAQRDAVLRATSEARMPPAGGPSDDERELLRVWLTCFAHVNDR